MYLQTHRRRQAPSYISSQIHNVVITLYLQTHRRRQAPSYISSQIHNVVFALLTNAQLSIRENAAKALSTFISLSDIQVGHKMGHVPLGQIK